jgi:large repetitive protein
MAKNIKVLVNTGNEETNKTFDVAQGSGKAGKPTRIKAVKGARYHLEDAAAKNVGPENIRSKRVSQLPC